LLGIGSSFTNATTIETYGLTSLLGNGTILHALLVIMNKVGSAVFDNLPLIFAVGVAIGMAKKEKEVSALSAVIAYFVMNTAINAMLTITGQILENGEIAGIALATIKDRTVRSIYIDAIFVLEPFRRRGIATRLFRQIQDTASEIGAERMDLMVWAFNAPALAFYKSLGMKEQRIVLEKQVKETD